MLRATLTRLAKGVAPAPAGKRALKRGALGGTKSGRSGSAKRRLSAAKRSTTAHRKPASARPAGSGAAALAGGDGSDAAPADGALVRVSSEESRTPQSSAATPTAAARAVTYRLATAVSTVVVPPLANAYLESMKQTLTPAVRRPQDSGLGDALGERVAAAAPVAQMEEYYTTRKGPLFATAVIAGTNAVKQASMLIPFCHPIPIQKCSFTFRRRAVGAELGHSALPHRLVLRRRSSPPSPRPSRSEYSVLYCFCSVATEEYKTGVEVEALTGATVAAMTLYDMLKGLPGAQEDGLSLGESVVLAKRGGRNDFIKLLMSEPERAHAERTALPSAAAEAPAGGPRDRASAGEENAADAQEDVTPPGAADKPEETEAETEAEAEAEVKSVAHSHKHAKKGATSRTPGDRKPAAEEGSPGDAGAWWRSTKSERRVQELFPRRKYGDGARVAPQPAVKAAAKSAPKTRAAQNGSAPAADDGDGEEEDDGAGVASSAAAVRRTHRSGGQLAKKSARAAVEAAPELEAEEAEEASEDEEDEVVAAAGAKRSKKKTAAKVRRAAPTSAGRASIPDEEPEPVEDGDDDAEDDAPAEPEPVSPPAKKGSSSAAARKAPRTTATSAAKKPPPPPPRSTRASAREAADEDDEEEMVTVTQDSWSDQTVVEGAEEEPAEEVREDEEGEDADPPPPPPPPPPAAKKLKKKKKLIRR